MNHSKFLVNLLELRKLDKTTASFSSRSTNTESFLTILNNELSKITLTVYFKTISIIANLNGTNQPDEYFISDGKLYKYDINGKNQQLVSGNFLISISNDSNYENKAFKITEGNFEEITTYFDGTNFKLIINNEEYKEQGTLILTDDYKIFVRIGNIWIGK